MFKIFPSGTAVKSERITGFNIIDCHSECRVTAVTEENHYYAETFSNRDAAKKYIADLVKELEGAVTVKIKEYDDGIFTTPETFDLLSVDEENIQTITVSDIQMLYFGKDVRLICGGNNIRVKKFDDVHRAADYVKKFVNDYGNWIHWKNYYFNVDKLAEVKVDRTIEGKAGYYEVYAVFDDGGKFKIYTYCNADDAFNARDFIQHELDRKKVD